MVLNSSKIKFTIELNLARPRIHFIEVDIKAKKCDEGHGWGVRHTTADHRNWPQKNNWPWVSLTLLML